MPMLEVKNFSVEKIPVGNRAAYWSSLIGGFIAEIQTIPYDKKNFQASLKVAEFGSLIMAGLMPVYADALLRYCAPARRPGPVVRTRTAGVLCDF